MRGTAWETRPEPFARGNSKYALTKLNRFLCDRWLVEVTSEADEEAALLLDSAEAWEPAFGHAAMAAYQALLVLRPRLAEIHDRAALALRLRQLADRQWPDLVRGAESSFALCADFLREPWQGARDHGLALPGVLDLPLTMRGLCRLGGARYLHYELD